MHKHVQLLESRVLDAMCRSLGERGWDESEFVLLYDGVAFTDPYGQLRDGGARDDLASGVARDVHCRTDVTVRLRIAIVKE